MASPPAAPVAPTYATERDPSYRTFGPKVAKLATSMQLPLMPWQQQVADTALEVDADGLYRYGLVVLTVPRQSGKTSLLRPVIAHRALARPKAEIWMTAQLREAARDTWGDTCDLIEDSPLAPLVKRRNTNGSECLTWSNRSRFRLFNAGSERSLHGKQTDLAFIDEAFAFSEDEGDVIMQAVVPTQATRPGAQIWIVSTAGTARSAWLRNFVKQGRAGANRRAAYFEWGIPEDSEDLTDLDLYARHHPALGYTISRDALEDAFGKMKPSEFARAYGNFWTSSDEWVIPPAIWARAASADSIDRSRPVAFSVEVAADRSGGCILACGYGRLTDRAMIEVIDARPGIGWITERLLAVAAKIRHATIVIDPVSPAGTIHRDLEERRARRERIMLAPFTAGELVDAHTELLDDLTTGALQQPGDKRLDAALGATVPRTLRETIVFSRKIADDGTSPAPAVAMVLAHHGHRHPVESDVPAVHSLTGSA